MKTWYLTLILLLMMTAVALAAVNINTARVDELSTLPWIGPVKAEAIVKYREKHGSFKKPENLKEVKGIGDATLEKIKQEVTVKKKK